MKKLFFLFFLISTSLGGFAQVEHMTFKGVPIDGSVNEMVSKLEKKGLKYIKTIDGTAVMAGSFASYNECTIFVGDQGTGTVCAAGVYFPEKDTWNLLYGNYSNIKELLIQKYGEPSSCIEQFQTSYPPEDNYMKMIYIKSDKYDYKCIWDTPNGIIELSIAHFDTLSSTCQVLLTYVDIINASKNKSNAIDDL